MGRDKKSLGKGELKNCGNNALFRSQSTLAQLKILIGRGSKWKKIVTF